MYSRAIRTFGFVHVPSVLLERRCGIASLINAGSASQFKESYQGFMHANYRALFGSIEFVALRAISLPSKAGLQLLR